MALGGGTYVTQNKILPGTYINFVGTAVTDSTVSERGIGALALEIDWGADDSVFELTSENVETKSLESFGYLYSDDKLKGIRDLFKTVNKCFFYKLMNTGVKASNTFADAKYKGVRGNDILIKIEVNVDDVTKMDVSTYIGTTLADKQTVLPNTDNLEDNSWVVWKTNITLVATAGLELTSGSNGIAITSTEYQGALDAFESYTFNCLGCLSTTDTIIDLYIAYVKRMRTEIGKKIQGVVYKTNDADDEGIVSVENTVTDSGALASSLVYWSLGALASGEVNQALTNTEYTGEYTVDVDYTQSELELGIESGKFMFHNVNGNVRVLEDINTLVNYTDEKTSLFSDNQTIRVIDKIASDIAATFNTKYLGKIPNDNSGRISFWNEIVKQHKTLSDIRAIETFDNSDLTVLEGDTKKSIVVSDAITIINTMEKLYMNIVVQ